MKPLKSRIISFIRNIHCCRISNHLYKLPGKSVWYNYSELFKTNVSYKYILVFATCLLDIDDTIFKDLKKRFPYCHIFVFVWDTIVEDSWWNVKKNITCKEIDKILTFDKNDATKFGWIYSGLCYYSKIDVPFKDIITDLYFAGKVKVGRLQLINDCYRYLSEKILCTFRVPCNNYNLAQGINSTNSPIEYIQYLKEIQSCNCILELVKEGQTGPTLRYFEAVCYNKKLLTNNQSVVDLPYYDKRYIHVFKTVSDIDTDWVARRESVDFHYDGSFSPIHLIKLVRELSERNNV
jgi:hypothetical protein